MAAAADAPSTPGSARPIRRRDPVPTLPAPTLPMSASEPDPPAEAADQVNARGKRAAWGPNPSPIIPAGVGTVMGASVWPALSEAAKPSPKFCVSPGSAALTASMPSSFVPSNAATNPNPAPAPAPPRQKPVKRVAGGPSGLPARPLLDSVLVPVPVPVPEIIPDRSPRGLSNSNFNSDHGGRGGGFQTHLHGGSDPSRGSGGGGNRRGHNGHGGFNHNRRDERGAYEWGNRNNYGGRDVHMQPPPPPPLPVRGVRPFMRAPLPIPPSFIASAPQQVRPFLAPIAPPMGYPDLASTIYYVAAPPPPEVLRGGPYVAHPPPPPPPMFYPVLDSHQLALLRQIEYYFSNENLCKDTYLRERMDRQGWAPVSVIAGFRRVKELTKDIPNRLDYIMDALRFSNIVEVQGYTVRRRGDWANWLIPREEPGTFAEALAARLESIVVEGVANQAGSSRASFTRSSSGNLSNQSQVIGDTGNIASSSSGDASGSDNQSQAIGDTGHIASSSSGDASQSAAF